MARIEHVNITVSDPQKTAALMNALFGWNIRWEGEAINGGYSVHVGDEEDYLAFYTPAKTTEPNAVSYDIKGGLNHVGIVVQDLDSVEKAVIEAGYTPVNHADYEPGKRFYFRDEDNIEFEIVSYA